MKLQFTQTQKQRLKELNANLEILNTLFESPQNRNDIFKKISNHLTKQNKQKLLKLRNNKLRPVVRDIEMRLINVLIQSGFIEVLTPITLSKGFLKKMGIHESHPLWKQVYWVDENRCLRPMLAPNLYYLLGHLSRLWEKPIRIFEVGPCFRKESQGAEHQEEFTMLNLVELSPFDDPKERLTALVQLVMKEMDLQYELKCEDSEVYGSTYDVIAKLEVASGAVGPHFLDRNWGIKEPWAGVGFGLERLAMVMEGHTNIKRIGRSLIYLNGARLNI